ncbi:MAG: hypothetical protein MJA83_09735, partial [Gammaproteobacteria bacterium]|nr:hypothetical protein [Gammaproteobacteria bacterium]
TVCRCCRDLNSLSENAVRLIEKPTRLVVTETSWLLSALLSLGGGYMFWRFYSGRNHSLEALSVFEPGFAWLAAAVMLFVMAYFSLKRREWCFDFNSAKFSAAERLLLYRKKFTAPFSDLRRVFLAKRTAMSRPTGRLAVIHSRGIIFFRNYASSNEYAHVKDIADRLAGRVALHSLDDEDIVRELIANKEIMQAVRVYRLLFNTSLKEARQSVERLSPGSTAGIHGAAGVVKGMRSLSVSEFVLLLVFLPFILLVLLSAVFSSADKSKNTAADD